MPKQQSSKGSTPAVQPGGYHSRGVPGDEAKVRKRMRVAKLSDKNKYIRKTPPLKGGRTAGSTSTGRLEAADSTGGSAMRALYVLARKDQDELETPVFHAGDSGEEEAVAVFIDRNKAILYLQVARWDKTHEPAALSPADLGEWLAAALDEGIHLVAVDLDRRGHLAGEPQRVLFLDEQVDRSGEALYRELTALGQP